MSSTACSVLNISLRNKLRQKIRAKEASRRSTKLEERAYRSLTIAAGLRTKKSHNDHDVDFEHAKPRKQDSDMMKTSALQDLALVIHNSVQMLAHKHATIDTDLDKYSDDCSDILSSEDRVKTILPEEYIHPNKFGDPLQENIEETVDETPLGASAAADLEVTEESAVPSELGRDVKETVLDSADGKPEAGEVEKEAVQSEIEGKNRDRTPGFKSGGKLVDECVEDEVNAASTHTWEGTSSELSEHHLIEDFSVGVAVEGELNRGDSRVLKEGQMAEDPSGTPFARECDLMTRAQDVKADDGKGNESTECPSLADFSASINAECMEDRENEREGTELVDEVANASLGKSFVQAQVDFVKSQLSSWLGPVDRKDRSEEHKGMSQEGSEMGDVSRLSVASRVSADSCFVRSESGGSLSGRSWRGGKGQKPGGAKSKRHRGKKQQDFRKSEDNGGRSHESKKHKTRKQHPAPRIPNQQSSENMQHGFHSNRRNSGHRKSKSAQSFQGSKNNKKPKTTLVLSCMEDVFMGDNPLVTLHFRVSGQDAPQAWMAEEGGFGSFWQDGGLESCEGGVVDGGSDWASGGVDGARGSLFLY